MKIENDQIILDLCQILKKWVNFFIYLLNRVTNANIINIY